MFTFRQPLIKEIETRFKIFLYDLRVRIFKALINLLEFGLPLWSLLWFVQNSNSTFSRMKISQICGVRKPNLCLCWRQLSWSLHIDRNTQDSLRALGRCKVLVIISHQKFCDRRPQTATRAFVRAGKFCRQDLLLADGLLLLRWSLGELGGHLLLAAPVCVALVVVAPV